MVWLNSNNVRDLRTPFGGVKASGLGHEGGYRSIDFYTDQQSRAHHARPGAHNPTFGKTLSKRSPHSESQFVPFDPDSNADTNSRPAPSKQGR